MQNFRPERGRYTYRTQPEGDHIKIELYYSLGGLNYATYKQDARGIWATIGAAYREITPTSTVERYGVFDGKSVRVFLLPQKRCNPATLKKVAEALDQHAPRIAALWANDRIAAIGALRENAGVPVTQVPGSVNAWATQGGAQ